MKPLPPGVVLLIAITALTVAALVLLSIRHWRKLENERQSMHANTRKFIGRAVSVLLAEFLVFAALMIVLAFPFARSNALLLNDGTEIVGIIKKSVYYKEAWTAGSHQTSFSLAALLAYNDNFHKIFKGMFTGMYVQYALYRENGEWVEDPKAELLSGVYFPFSSFMGVEIGGGQSEADFRKAQKAVYRRTTEDAALSGSNDPLIKFLQFFTSHPKGDEVIYRSPDIAEYIPLKFENTQFDFAQKVLLAPTGSYDEEQAKPVYEFIALGNEDVDKIVQENPAMAEHVHILYGKGDYPWAQLLFVNNGARMDPVVIPTLLLYILMIFWFVSINIRMIGRRERQILHRQQEHLPKVVHEMKTPLSVLRLLAEKVQLESDPQKKEAAAGQLVDRADAMTAIVTKNLSETWLENTEITLVPTEFSLRDTVQACAEDYAVLLEERGLRMRLLGMEKDTVVFADPMRIKEAVSNLLTNAIKYAQADSEITLCLNGSKRGVKFSLRNDCQAIDKDDLRRLWEPYFRLNRDKGGGARGAGLGLAIVRSRVMQHGGRYGTKNVPGGVELWFWIPIRAKEKKAGRP